MNVGTPDRRVDVGNALTYFRAPSPNASNTYAARCFASAWQAASIMACTSPVFMSIRQKRDCWTAKPSTSGRFGFIPAGHNACRAERASPSGELPSRWRAAHACQ